MRRPIVLVALIGTAVFGGCSSPMESGEPGTNAETTTTTASATTSTTTVTTSAQPITTTTVPVYPSGDPILPGYPLVVPVDTIDERVASWFEGQLVDGQVVAVAPGVYTPVNPVVPDLGDYLDVPNDGDCAVRNKLFPETGGACWDGVQAGTAEP
jgi:hypothetical protein